MKQRYNPTDTVLEHYHGVCQYCGERASGTDHIVPFSYLNGHGGKDNLVSACQVCNSIAGDKIFENFQEKRAFILARRAELRQCKRKNICPDCGHYFRPKLSNVLCNRCYKRGERDLSQLIELPVPSMKSTKPTAPHPVVYNPKPRFKDGVRPVPELALSLNESNEEAYYTVLELLAPISLWLNTPGTHCWVAGQMCLTLDEVVAALLRGELMEPEE